MYPILFKVPIFGGITIHSYGPLVALGFLAGLWWIAYESKKLGQNPALIMDLAFYVILSGIIGSRILNVAVSERDRFFENPLMIFKLWEGGLVYYGGLILSIIVGVWYIRRHKLPILLTCDIFAPAISIGHAIGRLGCLTVGCCYGRVVDHPVWYSIIFSAKPHTFAPTGVPLYPTQLMEVFGELIIFCVLLSVRKYKRFDGQLIITYLMLYSVLRAFNEFFRGDVERGFLIEPWVSTSEFISVIIFAVGCFLYIKLWRKAKKG